MSGTKTEFNNQWGRTSVDGDQPIPANITPAPGDNRGKEPLVDLFGRQYVVLADPSGGGGGINIGNVVPIPGAVTNVADSLQSNRFALPGIPTLFVDTGPGKFYLLNGYNPTNSARFLMMFDLPGVVAPGDGAFPLYMVKLGTDNMEPSSPEINFINLGVRYAASLKVAISTTPNVLTLPAADNYWMHVLYYNQ